MKAKFPEGTPDDCIEVEHQLASHVGGPVARWLDRPEDKRHMYVVFERLLTHRSSYCKATGPPFHSDVLFGYVMVGGIQCPTVTVRSAAYTVTRGVCNCDSPAKEALFESYLTWKHTL